MMTCLRFAFPKTASAEWYKLEIRTEWPGLFVSSVRKQTEYSNRASCLSTAAAITAVLSATESDEQAQIEKLAKIEIC